MPSANAVVIAKIPASEIDDITTEDGKNAAAVTMERMGGKARAGGHGSQEAKRSSQESSAR